LEKPLPRAASGDGCYVLDELLRIEEARNRRPFLGLFVDHNSGADAAIGVAAARKRAPLRIGTVHEIRKSPKVAMNEMGNQSRVGSTLPTWRLTSCARCESV